MSKSITLLALVASLVAAASSDETASYDSTTSYSDIPSCTTSAESILSAFPTPRLQDEDLIGYFQSVLGGGSYGIDSTVTDLCVITSAPSGPIQTAYASYTSAIWSWSSAQAGAIEEVISKCKGSGDPELEVEQAVTAASVYVGEGCPGNSNAPITASPTAAPSGSASASGSASVSGAATSPTSTRAPNAGARANGASVAGVLAVAAAVAMI